MQTMIEAEGKRRRAEINEIEDRMKSRVVTLVEDHDRALRGAEEYYSAIQTKLLADQKELKVRGGTGWSEGVTAQIKNSLFLLNFNGRNVKRLIHFI